MLNQFRQILVTTKVFLIGTRQRLALSFSMILSISLVVGILCGMLSMSLGFELALKGAGSPNVAVLLGGGTSQEAGSDVPTQTLRALQAIQSDIGVQRNSSGELLLSREVIVAIDVTDPTEGGAQQRTLALRGMDEAGLNVRDNVNLTQGRFFAPGARELVVGEQLSKRYPHLQLGSQVILGPVAWTVVGTFSAHGSALESEIWSDLEAVRSTFNRQGQIQSVRLALMGSNALDKLKYGLASLTGAPLIVKSENRYFSEQSHRTATLIRVFGWPIAILIAVGATSGALNTMMSAVSHRVVEVATLRALGFSRLSVFVATTVEGFALAAIGVFIGVFGSWFVFHGMQASTIGANESSTVFQLIMSEDIVAAAVVLGLSIGFLGSSIPAYSSSRMPLPIALRRGG